MKNPVPPLRDRCRGRIRRDHLARGFLSHRRHDNRQRSARESICTRVHGFGPQLSVSPGGNERSQQNRTQAAGNAFPVMDKSAQGCIRHLLPDRAVHLFEPVTEKVPRLRLAERFDDRPRFCSPNEIAQLGILKKIPELRPPGKNNPLVSETKRVEAGYDLQIAEHIRLQIMGVVEYEDDLTPLVIQSERVK